jgi:RND family efflux transporter MFP subunit
MKVNSGKKFGYVVAVVVVGFIVFFALLLGKPKPQLVDETQVAAPLVDVLVVEPSTRVLNVRTQGTVQSRREIDLVARVAGEVTEVSAGFAAGGFMDEAAQLLAIDDSDHRFALIRAEARVADAAQLLASEKGRAYQARREWRDLGNPEANKLFLRKPQLASTEAAYLAAEADRDQAQLDVERTHILAPFNGRIRETYVDLGQYVNAGSKIARFYSTDVVEVRLPLTDRQLSLLDLPFDYQNTLGDEDLVPVILKGTVSGKEWEWQGHITRTDASIDVESRVVYAVAEVAMPFERQPGSNRPPLSIGKFVQAEIQGRELEDIVILPRKALRAERKVWLLNADQQLEPIDVDVLYSDGQRVAVRGSFGERAKVVVSSLNIAVAGMKLAERKPEDMAEVE